MSAVPRFSDRLLFLNIVCMLATGELAPLPEPPPRTTRREAAPSSPTSDTGDTADPPPAHGDIEAADPLLGTLVRLLTRKARMRELLATAERERQATSRRALECDARYPDEPPKLTVANDRPWVQHKARFYRWEVCAEFAPFVRRSALDQLRAFFAASSAQQPEPDLWRPHRHAPPPHSTHPTLLRKWATERLAEIGWRHEFTAWYTAPPPRHGRSRAKAPLTALVSKIDRRLPEQIRRRRAGRLLTIEEIAWVAIDAGLLPARARSGTGADVLYAMYKAVQKTLHLHGQHGFRMQGDVLTRSPARRGEPRPQRRDRLDIAWSKWAPAWLFPSSGGGPYREVSPKRVDTN